MLEPALVHAECQAPALPRLPIAGIGALAETQCLLGRSKIHYGPALTIAISAKASSLGHALAGRSRANHMVLSHSLTR